ncbi:gamma-glutamyltransferase family protein [Paracoccus onubensis]|uniref:gamma-glutamyltransferase family protein n=1 Tax=Paracoccus onubensis TaxID=1675788 RepID=UPI00272F67E9|nr:gamma-glutamyltransferase family protein [Paracoccus onubensis]MDP0930308.1 gamma-glutamyltransferase family protein [Paracoccus onubensis]
MKQFSKEFRDFDRCGRSEAFGTRGMAATSHPLATMAALDVLKAGGNAVDAAVAAAAMQAVVEPTQTGIGGDCFAIIMRADGSIAAVNGSGWSPAGLDFEKLLESGQRHIAADSADAVTVPGAVGTWEKLLSEHGSKDLAVVLAPAIAAAQDGTPVTERLARDWRRQTSKLSQRPETAAAYLFLGEPPDAGEIHRSPALAATLRAIGSGGAAAFYQGSIAQRMVDTLRRAGGTHVEADFAEYTAEAVSPIRTSYRGYDLWECPPNGQGVVPLIAASILDGIDLSQYDPLDARRLHVIAEAARLAYAERDIFVGDPRLGSVDVEDLLSQARSADRRARISMSARIADLTPAPLPRHSDTVFIATVDRDGTAVSLINSIFDDFGCGIFCPQTGVLFHNRGCGFVLERGHLNAAAPRKRPLNTIIPAMLARDGRPVMPFGVTGAHFQPIGQIQLLSAIVDHGLTVQAALDLPRIFAFGDVFELEAAIPETVCTALSALGHTITRPANPLGTGQAIWIDQATGLLRGGGDRPPDGLALGY